MSLSISEIKRPIESEMRDFEKRFHDAMKTKVPLLDRIMTYIVKNKGKQIRPMFVFLAAGTCGTIDDRTYRGASLVELLHTATLIHDDVVDDSYERRGLFSINALWKNKIAVLVGDYLLSKGLLLSLDNDDFDLLKITSRAVKEMSEGELLQMEKSRSMKTGEDVYFEIITKKTASLIAACCAIGAASVGSDRELVEKMRKFGEMVGICFQIKDDLFDYGDDKIGKLSKVSNSEKNKIKRIIKSEGRKRKGINTVIQFVKENGGIDYARKKMFEYQDESYKLLDTLPDGEHKESLRNLVKFTVERKK